MSEAYDRHKAPTRRLNHLKRLAYFAEVVETGSFTAAAERLGITKAVVSQQVARLEEAFQTTLLVRTTRSVRLTEEGRAFYERCARILIETQEAFDGLSARDHAPSGTLTLTAPFDYGVAMVVPALAVFCQRFPACKVDLSISDQTLDPVQKDIELAIRVGWLVDSSLRARRIGTFRQLLVGAPAQADQLAKDADPLDLTALPFVANNVLKDPLRWSFSRGDLQRRVIIPSAAMGIDSTLGVLEAVRAGFGVSVLPDFTVRDDLQSGRLVHLLPDWALNEGGIYAVTPATRFQASRVKAFLDVLSEAERSRSRGR